jgi:hypothetical protein
LAGVVMLEQVLQIELDPLQNVTQTVSSNGLRLTIGAF